MKTVSLLISFNDDLGLKSVAIQHNDTGLPENSVLLQKVAYTILKALSLNKDSIAVQDLLNELDIQVEK